MKTWSLKYFPNFKGDFFKHGAGAFSYVDQPLYKGSVTVLKYIIISIPLKDDESKSVLAKLCLKAEKPDSPQYGSPWFYWHKDGHNDKLSLYPSVPSNGHYIDCVIKNGILKKGEGDNSAYFKEIQA